MRQREIERKARVKAAQARLQKLKEQLHAETYNEDGSVSSFIPLSHSLMREMSNLEATISRNEKLLKPKRVKQVKELPADFNSVALFTDQMLAKRWFCSTSRLQYWRSNSQGLPYLKIHGRVLYRIEDIVTYELQSRVTPQS
jgi:hypothetical protein